MHNWTCQIERIEESTKRKRVNIWIASAQSDQSLLCVHEESLGP